jgi:hypothetical protein
VTRLLLGRLTSEYPNLFSWTMDSERSGTLNCALTGATLRFDSHGRFSATRSDARLLPPYADAIDALCCQFPEDLGIVCRDPNTGDDWLAKLHVCAPSHWAPAEKIGQSWRKTHDPVPGMEKSRSAAGSIVRLMVEREPTVRFTWGIERDDRLNQHPESPHGSGSRRVPYDGDRELFYLRVERQVIWGLPEVNAAIFTIRVYHTPGTVLKADSIRREALHSALLSMNEESRRYKGLSSWREEVLSYLSS